jgi:pimeloyl-ACP methyl ester carboxylesterase
MPTATNDGVTLYYETAGIGPTVVFLNDVGYGAWLWGWHHDALAGPYETLAWDLRGTGRSDAPPGPYDVATLASDLEAVLSECGVDRAHLVGAGLGGMVALAYAHEYGRARTLTLYNTAGLGAAIDEPALRGLRRAAGPQESLAGAFSPAFRTREELIEQITEWRRDEDASERFGAQVAATLDFEPPPLYEITQPVSVYYGVDDPVVSPDAAESLAEALPRGDSTPVEGRHLAFVEQADAVTDELHAWLDDHAERSRE